jgi:hypothetical protein
MQEDMNRVGIPRFTLLMASILWICALVPSALAGLSWDSREVTARPSPGASTATAEFHFRNIDGTAITIASVHPACGCTTAKLEKTRYASGEAGMLIVTFTIGDRTGPQRKTIEVQEAGEKAPDVLTLAVPLPEPMKVSPGALEWRIGGAPEAKDIQVSATSGMQLDRAVATSAEFQVRSAPSSKGGWTIEVRPLDCGGPMTALLRVYFAGQSSGAVLVPLRIR